MKPTLHSACIAVLAVVAASGLGAQAQDYVYATGNPTFGVNIPIENGYINVTNGNIHFELPLAQNIQRGALQLNERLVYDSRIWQIVDNGGLSWQPTNVPNSMDGWRFTNGMETGTVSFNSQVSDYYVTYSKFAWTDPQGTAHPFNFSTYRPNGNNGEPPGPTASGYAIDASGYYASVTNYTTMVVQDNNGNQVYPQVIDRFGNYWSTDANGNLIDDLGRTPVTTTTSGNQITYSVLIAGGAHATYTVTTEQLNVGTDFKENAVTEFSGTLTAIEKIQLPDGSAYSFSYDGYGEMNSMTLPTGGVVNLGYSNYEDSYQNENRWLTSYSGGHGSLTFAPSVVTQCTGTQETGCQEQMKMTDAGGNDTVYTLTLNNGAWNSTTVNYQGSMSGGHPLIDDALTYNFTNPCPTGQCVGDEFITKESDVRTLSDVGYSTQTLYSINSTLGKIASLKQWAYYTGTPPGAPNVDYEYTYTGTDLTQAEVLNGAGNELSLTNYTFNTTATPMSGIVGHGTTNAGGPYLASVSQWINSPSGALTTTFTNDDTGAQLTSTGPNGETAFTRDATDSCVTGTTPPTPSSGTPLPSSATCDPSTGLLTSTTDADGAVTTYKSYDWAGRSTEIDYPDGGTWTASYSATGNTVSHTMYAGVSSQTETEYDGYGRLNRQATANGQSSNPWYQVDYCYDDSGRLQFQSYPYKGTGFGGAKVCSGAGDGYSYDALNRVTQVLHADGTSVAYQYKGGAIETTDESGVQRIQQVDALGRISEVCEISNDSSMPGSGSPVSCGTDIAGTGFVTAYTYNLGTHTSTVTQGAQSRVIVTDSLGRAVSVQEPERGQTTYSYAYNSTGLQVTRMRPKANQTNAGVLTTTTSQYDSVGRLVSVGYNDTVTPNKSYHYDNTNGSNWSTAGSAVHLKGRLAYTNSGSGATATSDLYSYDSMGRVTSIWQCAPSICGTSNQASRPTLGFSYDWTSDLLTEFDGVTGGILYGRSPAGEVTSITNQNYTTGGNPADLVSGVQNGPYGPTNYNLGNGLGVSYGYDSLGRRAGNWICVGSDTPQCPGVTQIFSYGLVWKGHQLQSSCEGVLNVCANYGYDQMDRLSSQTITYGTGPNYSFGYDRWGNRTAQTVTAGTGDPWSAAFNTATNQIVGYSYDAAGNMIKDGSHQYEYDAEGNVLSVDLGDTAQYVYDAMNHRVRDQNPATTLEFLYDYAGRRISAWSAANNTGYAGWIYWGQTPVAFRTTDGTTYFDHFDWVGTERLHTNYQGTVEASYLTYPFGDGYTSTILTQAANEDNTGFAGMKFDAETYTDHAQYRQYSPAEGRWMSPDPFSGSYDFTNPQSMNRYSYVGNNPVAFNDPSGQFTCNICGGNNGSGSGLITFFIDIGEALASFLDLGGSPSFHGSLKPRADDPQSYLTAPFVFYVNVYNPTMPTATILPLSYASVPFLIVAPGNGQTSRTSPTPKQQQCIAQVRSNAEGNGTKLEILGGLGLGNAVVGCFFTGPFISECEGGVAGLELLYTGVNFAAEQYSIHQGIAACMQQ